MATERPTRPCPNCDGSEWHEDIEDHGLVVRDGKALNLNASLLVYVFTCATCGLVQLYRTTVPNAGTTET